MSLGQQGSLISQLLWICFHFYMRFVGHNSQMHSVCGGRKGNGLADLRTYFSRHPSACNFSLRKTQWCWTALWRWAENGTWISLPLSKISNDISVAVKEMWIFSFGLCLFESRLKLPGKGKARLTIGNGGNKKHAQRSEWETGWKGVVPLYFMALPQNWEGWGHTFKVSLDFKGSSTYLQTNKNVMPI